MTDTQQPNIPAPRNIVAVASGKGGVGKTWFSISLSHALARKGKRVLLFDGDLGLANVDVQLGLSPKIDLTSVIEGHATLKGAITRYEEGGFDIIPGRSGTGSLASLPAPLLSNLRMQLADLAPAYDRVVLDLGAGVNRTVQQLAASAGTTIVITTDEPTALTDAYAFIKLGHEAIGAENISVVVNMAPSTREGLHTYETLLKACQNFLHISPILAGIVRRDSRVRDAIRNQSPLFIRYPACDAASDVESIAGKLLA